MDLVFSEACFTLMFISFCDVNVKIIYRPSKLSVTLCGKKKTVSKTKMHDSVCALVLLTINVGGKNDIFDKWLHYHKTHMLHCRYNRRCTSNFALYNMFGGKGG